MGGLGGGIRKLYNITYTFKLLLDINWFTITVHTPKRSIGVSLQYSVHFLPVLYVIKISMTRRNSPDSGTGPLILLLVYTIMTSSTKHLGRKREII